MTPLDLDITKTPGVCGGVACIKGTRIPVWVIESYRRSGAELSDFAEIYPHISAEQIAAGIDYAARHAEEIEAELTANQEGETR